MQIIHIVDRGRGPQLSTSRITVQDLVPYFQRGCSYDEIVRWIPSLTHAEIAIVEQYIREHYGEVIEQDRRIRERGIARRLPLEVEEAQRNERRKRLDDVRCGIRQRRQEQNGDPASG